MGSTNGGVFVQVKPENFKSSNFKMGGSRHLVAPSLLLALPCSLAPSLPSSICCSRSGKGLGIDRQITSACLLLKWQFCLTLSYTIPFFSLILSFTPFDSFRLFVQNTANVHSVEIPKSIHARRRNDGAKYGMVTMFTHSNLNSVPILSHVSKYTSQYAQ
jgi:hypothetical protein